VVHDAYEPGPGESHLAMPKRRWCVTACGHVWPSQYPEDLWRRHPETVRPHGGKEVRVRGVGAMVRCLVCGEGSVVTAHVWRWPDVFDALPWPGGWLVPECLAASEKIMAERSSR
jgi:hypothetical protein